MAADRPEAPKEGAAVKIATEEPAVAAATTEKNGLTRWLPLAVNVILMPLLAYLTTTFLLLPKLRGEAAATTTSKPAAHAAAGESNTDVGKTKFVVPLGGKVLVNIAGTMGTRYLQANLALVSGRADLKELVERNDAQLRDVAAGVLATKTIADLEKPGARNLIRAELIAVFNNVMSDGTVTELYLTEFAIQ